MSKLFESPYKLNFADKKIEEKYDKYFLDLIRSNIKVLAILYFLASLASTILITIYFDYINKTNYPFSVFLTYIITFILLVMAIVIFSMKNRTGFKMLTLVHYYLILFIFIDFRFALIKIINTNNLLYFIMICGDMCTRFVLILLGIFNFPSLFLANISTISSFWIFYFCYSKHEKKDSNLLFIGSAYSITISIVVIFSYYIIKTQKTSFYYDRKEKNSSWSKDLLDNMNTGFLSIKKNRISYVNTYLFNFMKTSKDFSRQISESTNEVLSTNGIISNDNADLTSTITPDYFVFHLLKNLQVDSIKDEGNRNVFQDLKTNCIQNENSQNLTNNFTTLFSQLDNTSKFLYIGEYCMEKQFSENYENNAIDKFTYFEIFCRIKQTSNDKKEINFMFKEVTDTKLREKIKAEFELKTLFFAKIAHEFKNPLICINELVKETNSLGEVTNLMQDSNKFHKNLSQISAMSNFLIILVRDLEYFSQIQVDETSTILIEKKATIIEEVLKFVEEICTSLIKKSNKSDMLTFVIKKAENVSRVLFTDEWRLKQILINLVSNAVKFTMNGEISLNVTSEEEWIKFEVIDTGIGIQEEMVRNIFNPYGKENRSLQNNVGSGLGLSIVKNLTSKLGKEIKFASNNSGSSFWFYIPSESPIKDALSEKSVKTINKTFNFDTINLDEFYPEESKSMSAKSNSSKNSLFNTNQNALIKIEDEEHNQPRNIEINTQENVEREGNVNVLNTSVNRVSFNTLPNIPAQNKYFSSLNVASQNTVSNLKLKSLLSSKFMQLKEQPKVNVIVADDEKIIRKAEKRLLMEAASLHQLQMNVIEAEDGYDTLYIIYKCLQQGITINLILSDQTMNYLTGTKSFKLVSDLLMSKNLQKIPFFLVTAYDKVDEENLKIFSKPLNFQKVEEIFKEVKLV